MRLNLMAYPAEGFQSIKWLWVLLLSLDGMPVRHRLPPCISSAFPDHSLIREPFTLVGGEMRLDLSVLSENKTLNPTGPQTHSLTD